MNDATKDPSAPPAEESLRSLLHHTADLAADYLESLPTRPVARPASAAELRERLGSPLPDDPVSARDIVSELAAAAERGIVASNGGRYFGFVEGGVLPAALAADWLTSAWDQNPGMYTLSPAAAVAEEVCAGWLLDLLGLPVDASVASQPARRWRTSSVSRRVATTLGGGSLHRRGPRGRGCCRCPVPC